MTELSVAATHGVLVARPRRDPDAPPWAHGYHVGALKNLTKRFAGYDDGLLYGPHGRYSELNAVADLDRGALFEPEPAQYIVARHTTRTTAVRDFVGDARYRIPPGVLHVSRMACPPILAVQTIRALAQGAPVVVECWQEHPGDREIVAALGCELAAVKIKASSEMRGVWTTAGDAPPPYPAPQQLALGQLPIDVPQDAVGALAAQLDGLAYADHYSQFNARQSWAALALRGFYDDPARIEKPAEMSKKWKAEHPDALQAQPRDTPLRAQLNACEPLLAAIPCQAVERVRLMRLEPGGGELLRHADITDRDAGAAMGRVVRVHIPVVTNPDVVFRAWRLDGSRQRLVMRPGCAYYLDTRKPHTAVNGGTTPRIHFVADVVADASLVGVLARAASAA